MSRLKWLKSMSAVLIGVLLGVLIGLYRPDWGVALGVFGDIYVSFLMMCVIPIVVTAIAGSLAKLLSAKDASAVLKKALLYFGGAMSSVAVIVIVAAAIFRPGNLSNEAKRAFGDILVNIINLAGAPAADAPSLATFLIDIIPSNLFAAFVEGHSLQILFFTILFGVLLGYSNAPSKPRVIEVIELLFDLFQSAISWSMYGLPIALLCIVSAQIARTGSGVIMAMLSFIVILAIVSIVVSFLCMVIIAIKARIPLRRQLVSLRPVLVMALATSNSVATMPVLLKVLTDEWRFTASTVNLVVPLGILMARMGMVMMSALGLAFTAQLYFVPLSLGTALVMVIGAMVSAVTTAGAPAVVSMGAVGVIADYLRLPYAATIPLLMAILPIVDPLLTVVNIMVAGLGGVLVAGKREEDAAAERVPDPETAQVAL